MATFPVSKHLREDEFCLGKLLQNPVVLSLSLLLISLLLILFTRRNFRNKGLNLPPSPPGLPVIGNLHQLGEFPHRSLRALSEKYGSLLLLRLGQIPTLVVSSPDIVKEIAKKHDIVFSSRPLSTAVDILVYGGNDMAFSPYGDYWRQTRRICSLQLLSLKRVLSFQSVRAEEVKSMINRLREASLNRATSVNLSEIIMSISNNIVSRCILGESFDAEEGGGSRVGKLGRRFMVLLLAFSVADYFPYFRWIDVLRGLIPSMKSTARDLDAFYNKVIEEHKATASSASEQNGHGSSRPKDFVDILLEVQKDGSMADFELTDDYIKALIQDMLLGGIETTSTAAEWLMSELMRNPRVMKKAQEEVRRVVGEKGKVESNDISSMEYLNCVMRENLRLHPPAAIFIPRITSKSIEIRGYHIPAGTKVLFNGWAIHRHPDFWEEPEEFIPERFVNNPVDFKSQEYFELIPFGFGRKQCPGTTFGLITIEYLVANLLYWFDWKLPTSDGGDATPVEVDMSEIWGATVHKKVPLRVAPIYYSP